MKSLSGYPMIKVLVLDWDRAPYKTLKLTDDISYVEFSGILNEKEPRPVLASIFRLLFSKKDD
jgi:hypothetical protein